MELVLYLVFALFVVAYGSLFRFQRFTLSIAREAVASGHVHVSVSSAQGLMTPFWFPWALWSVQAALLFLVVFFILSVSVAVGIIAMAADILWPVLVAPFIPLPNVDWLHRTVENELETRATGDETARHLKQHLLAKGR